MTDPWRLVGLPPGNVSLRVAPPGGFAPPGMVIATEGQQDVLIRLAKGMSIVGRVVLPEGMTQVGGNRLRTLARPWCARSREGGGAPLPFGSVPHPRHPLGCTRGGEGEARVEARSFFA